MSLSFAILTALCEHDATGIALARRFDKSIAYFWTASHQQIYRELGKLAEAGHVDVVDEPDRRIDRGQPRLLRITPAGREALIQWISTVDEPSMSRESIMVRLRAAAAVGRPDAVESVLRHHVVVHEAKLATYHGIEQRDFADSGDQATKLQAMVLQAGIMLETTWVQWCRDALALIQAGDDPA